MLLDSVMHKSGSCCWPAVSTAVNHAVEAVDLAATEPAVALAFLLFNEVFLLAEPKGWTGNGLLHGSYMRLTCV